MDEFVRAASTAEIPPGAAKQVVVGGRRIAIVNLSGTFYAIDDTCSHEDQSLSEGPVTGDLIVCPRHGSRFHIPTGRVLSLPAARPVSTYQVKVEGEEVFVSPTPAPGQGMPHRS